MGKTKGFVRFLTCSKSLVLTILLATDHTKVLILYGALDFQMNFDGGKWARFKRLDRAKKKWAKFVPNRIFKSFLFPTLVYNCMCFMPNAYLNKLKYVTIEVWLMAS